MIELTALPGAERRPLLMVRPEQHRRALALRQMAMAYADLPRYLLLPEVSALLRTVRWVISQFCFKNIIISSQIAAWHVQFSGFCFRPPLICVTRSPPWGIAFRSAFAQTSSLFTDWGFSVDCPIFPSSTPRRRFPFIIRS